MKIFCISDKNKMQELNRANIIMQEILQNVDQEEMHCAKPNI